MFPKINPLWQEKGLFTFYKQQEQEEALISNIRNKRVSNSSITQQPQIQLSNDGRLTMKKQQRLLSRHHSQLMKENKNHAKINGPVNNISSVGQNNTVKSKQHKNNEILSKFLSNCLSQSKKQKLILQRQDYQSADSIQNKEQKKIEQRQQSKTNIVCIENNKDNQDYEQQSIISSNITKIKRKKNIKSELVNYDTPKIPNIILNQQIKSHQNSLRLPSNSKIALPQASKARQSDILSDNPHKNNKQKRQLNKKYLQQTKKRKITTVCNKQNSQFPLLPQSIRSVKRRKIKNQKYLEQKSDRFPYLSLIKLEQQNNSDSQSRRTAQINMNYRFPEQIFHGWQSRKKQLFQKLINKII